MTEIFPPEERGRALGVVGSTVSVGIAVGPPLGGLLIGLIGWHSIFLVNVPVGIVALFVITRFVPSSPTRPGQRFDFAGAIILFFSMGTYAIGMTLGQDRGFGNPITSVLLVIALIGLIALILVENRIHQPMIDLRLFRNVLFSLNLLMGMLVFIVNAGFFIIPFFLELVKGYPTEIVGLLMMANPIVVGLIAPVAGSLSDRYGSRGISVIGLTLVVVGCLTLSTLNEGVGPIGFVLRLLPIGLGLGMFQSPNNSAIMGAAPKNRLGVASGLLSLSRTLGQTTGLPLMGAMFTALVVATSTLATGADVTSAPASALVAGVNGTYRIAAFIVLGATLLAGLALWIDSRNKKSLALEQKAETKEEFNAKP